MHLEEFISIIAIVDNFQTVVYIIGNLNLKKKRKRNSNKTSPVSKHGKIFVSILEPIYIQRQRRVCDIAATSLLNWSQNDSPVTAKLVAVAVANTQCNSTTPKQLIRFGNDVAAMSQSRCKWALSSDDTLRNDMWLMFFVLKHSFRVTMCSSKSFRAMTGSWGKT